MFTKNMTIAGFDDELWQAMQNEVRRQEDHIELIASENYASPLIVVLFELIDAVECDLKLCAYNAKLTRRLEAQRKGGRVERRVMPT